jgi:hypothetical protein
LKVTSCGTGLGGDGAVGLDLDAVALTRQVETGSRTPGTLQERFAAGDDDGSRLSDDPVAAILRDRVGVRPVL